MSVVKNLALGFVCWGMLGTTAQADPMIMDGGSAGWTLWIAGTGARLSTDSAPDAGQAPIPTPAQPASPPPPSAPTPPPSPSAPPRHSLPSSPGAGWNPSPGSTADAFINLGVGPYPGASYLTSGVARPWYTSPSVTRFFGGRPPDPRQQADFARDVLQRAQRTFHLSGLDPRLTIDPTEPANHTLSVVSHTSYGLKPNGIGKAEVGGDGFGFVDKLRDANSLDELEWAVAHNVSHELMHTFGVADHPDRSRKHLDAARATRDLLTDPEATFSPTAVAEARSRDFRRDPSGVRRSQIIESDLEILAAPVPEPRAVAVWGLVAAGLVLHRRRVSQRPDR